MSFQTRSGIHACDPSSQARGQASQINDVKVFSSAKQALKSNDYDYALIASPTRSHITDATLMAKAGVHVLVEKPLSHSMSGVSQLLKTLKNRKKRMAVGCNLRFQPSMLKMKNLIKGGVLGKVTAVRAQSGHWQMYPGKNH